MVGLLLLVHRGELGSANDRALNFSVAEPQKLEAHGISGMINMYFCTY